MVKPKIKAAKKLAINPNIITESTDRNNPKYKASSGLTFPEGIGRLSVLAITKSISESHHIFNAPAAPDPNPIKITEAIAMTGCINSCEATIPTTVVKITSLITLGFINSKKALKSALG